MTIENSGECLVMVTVSMYRKNGCELVYWR